MAELTFTRLEQVLDEYARQFEQLTKRKLVEGDNVASGALLGSIKTRVEHGGYIYTVWLDSKDYLKYLEGGTRPHYPPIAPLIRWAREKKSIATREKTGDKHLPTEKQVAYAVKNAIGKRGTKPRPVIASTEEELNAIYTQKFVDALTEDVVRNLQIIHIQLRFK